MIQGFHFIIVKVKLLLIIVQFEFYHIRIISIYYNLCYFLTFLFQILDAEMFDLMHQNGDYTHFYFCYRWFLLDFKRGQINISKNKILFIFNCTAYLCMSYILELLYEDVFIVWETIWAAKHIASSHFVLFIALAMVEYYRDIILENNMDFTDIIKFFNGNNLIFIFYYNVIQ